MRLGNGFILFKKRFIIVMLLIVTYIAYQYTKYTKLGNYLNLYTPNNKEVYIDLSKVFPFEYDEIISLGTLHNIDSFLNSYGYSRNTIIEHIDTNITYARVNLFFLNGLVVYSEAYKSDYLFEGGEAADYRGIIEFAHPKYPISDKFHSKYKKFSIKHVVKKAEYGNTFDYFQVWEIDSSKIK